MTKHTPEPWHVRQGRLANEGHTYVDAVFNNGFKRWVAETTFSVSPDGKDGADANARRIVACVNSCAGIPTEALESGALEHAIAVALPSILANLGNPQDNGRARWESSKRYAADALAKLRGEG